MRYALHPIDEEKLASLAKAFYQAYRVCGTVRMTFGIRGIADSDGNSVIDVYLSPHDAQARFALSQEERACHLQFLEAMVPARLMGYAFTLKLSPLSADQVQVETLNVSSPLAAGPASC
ncbi:hypothetical protein [Vampirovibrio chlorellavorus]|uniref:hypothetical protein n=1 Tax=Vampirovibrio chlorellavorus TaxID=758823 RepID=UPI0026F30D7B|nr:hypothetical protein [Vampirovibrio chlorellavorus]